MSPDERPELPLYVQQAWGAAPRARRGPKSTMTLDAIIGAGIELASADGLEGVSMARVATRLGASTMALYRYLASKDDLLALMVDAAYGPAPEVHRTRGWRAGLRRWAEAARTSYQRHPWMLDVPIRGIPLTPNQLGWMDDALRCLARTPLGEQEKLSCLLLLSGFVRSASKLEADIATASADAPASPGALIASLIDPRSFPALSAAVRSGALDDEGGFDGEFRFELDRVLDGIAAVIERHHS